MFSVKNGIKKGKGKTSYEVWSVDSEENVFKWTGDG